MNRSSGFRLVFFFSILCGLGSKEISLAKKKEHTKNMNNQSWCMVMYLEGINILTKYHRCTRVFAQSSCSIVVMETNRLHINSFAFMIMLRENVVESRILMLRNLIRCVSLIKYRKSYRVWHSWKLRSD